MTSFNTPLVINLWLPMEPMRFPLVAGTLFMKVLQIVMGMTFMPKGGRAADGVAQNSDDFLIDVNVV